jgi:acid phosphatase
MSKYGKRSAIAAFVAAAVATGGFGSTAAADNSQGNDQGNGLGEIQTIVVIYAENRSFDNLFGMYPGANGLSNASLASATQIDRDGSAMTQLPPVWGGTDGKDASSGHASAITAGAPAAPQPLTEAQTETYFTDNAINHPFSLLSLYGNFSFTDTNPLQYTNRDLYHRFYENQMQINGGSNNKFAAWADSGGLVMMYIPNNDNDHPLWALARQNVLADNFFQSAFGGSYLNHQFLICSCAPIYPGDGTKPVNPTSGGSAPVPSAVNGDGVTLTTKASSPAKAAGGPPQFVNSSTLTPAIDGTFYSINTSQPPFPPSGTAKSSTPPQQSVDLTNAGVLPPQTQTTIGDLLTAAGVDWAYYASAWNFALSNPPFSSGTSAANPNFQYHHQPFNYFEAFDPSTPAGAANREAHLKDAGVVTPAEAAAGTLPDSQFLTDILTGNLPAVTFYKPHGTVNEHNGYANVTDGDKHIAAVVAALQESSQYRHMLIVITYDENGGIWDHVAPPKGDRFGPGSRIPAIIVSPFVKQGFVDHTQYDTTSILRFITRKWHLPVLPGITSRDAALVANGYPPMGDLTNALKGGGSDNSDGNNGQGNGNGSGNGNGNGHK